MNYVYLDYCAAFGNVPRKSKNEVRWGALSCAATAALPHPAAPLQASQPALDSPQTIRCAKTSDKDHGKGWGRVSLLAFFSEACSGHLCWSAHGVLSDMWQDVISILSSQSLLMCQTANAPNGAQRRLDRIGHNACRLLEAGTKGQVWQTRRTLRVLSLASPRF